MKKQRAHPLPLVAEGLVGPWLIVCDEKQLLQVSKGPSPPTSVTECGEGCQQDVAMIRTLESQDVIQQCPLGEEECLKGGRAMGPGDQGYWLGVTGHDWPAVLFSLKVGGERLVKRRTGGHQSCQPSPQSNGNDSDWDLRKEQT